MQGRLLKLHGLRCFNWTRQNYGGIYFWQQVLLGSGLDVQVGPAPWEVNGSLSARPGSDLY